MSTDARIRELERMARRSRRLALLMNVICVIGVLDMAGGAVLIARSPLWGCLCTGCAGLPTVVYFLWIAGGGRDVPPGAGLMPGHPADVGETMMDEEGPRI